MSRLRSTFSRLTARRDTRPATQAPAKLARAVRPMLENLEGRQLMSATLHPAWSAVVPTAGYAYAGPISVSFAPVPPLDVPVIEPGEIGVPVVTPVASMSSTDIGSTGGSTAVITDGADYDLTSVGQRMNNVADAFRFTGKSVAGDFDVKVRVDAFTGGAARAKAALMARESLAAGSRDAFVAMSKADGFYFGSRATTGGDTANARSGTSTPTTHLRLKRVGNTFTGYRSADGVTWTKISSATVAMPSTVQLGLGVSSHGDVPAPATAKFRAFGPTAPAAPVTATSIAWADGVSAPYVTQESITIQVGSKMYMWGGFINDDSDVTSQGWVFDLPSNKWSRVADAPGVQNHVGVTASDDGRFIYFAGGIDDRSRRVSTNKCWKYDIAADKFTSFTALPEVRIGGALAYVGGKLHYFGGDLVDRVTPSDKHWAISVDAATGNATGGWQSKAKMLMPSDHHSGMVIGGKIYAVGGEEGHSTTYIQHNTMSLYDPATDKWSPLAPMPRASSHFEGGTLVVHERIVVMGGQGEDEKIIADVRVYDPVSNTWMVLNDMPGTRKGGNGAFHDGKLYYTTGRGSSEDGRSRVNAKNTWVGTIANGWW